MISGRETDLDGSINSTIDNNMSLGGIGNDKSESTNIKKTEEDITTPAPSSPHLLRLKQEKPNKRQVPLR